ncbi:peptidyl-prolyl cis-trans isomerase [Tropicimonas sp. IMCC34043]|uniref:peptidylprolyl isomerase n=1 Tax=Tropicimonas sp. IMCC34043 TaxID=2248760 RepID=UPI0018E53A61|nr:peptidylprolyl isomerase [Tropicimonas sp. IMCC34043]
MRPDEAVRLVAQFTATWSRPPSERELEDLMQRWALEEALTREALALGLDRGDPVIRQRLVLKMQYLAESGASAEQPDDAELQAYVDANPGKFEQPAEVAFSQVLLSPTEDPVAIRVALDGGTDPAQLGEAGLLPLSLPLTPLPVIGRMFGTDFAAAITDLPEDIWQGPVRSGYGQHMVRVTGRTAAMLPPLPKIRDRVEGEWRSDQARQMREAFGKELLGRHTVTLPTVDEVLGK